MLYGENNLEKRETPGQEKRLRTGKGRRGERDLMFRYGNKNPNNNEKTWKKVRDSIQIHVPRGLRNTIKI